MRTKAALMVLYGPWCAAAMIAACRSSARLGAGLVQLESTWNASTYLGQ